MSRSRKRQSKRKKQKGGSYVINIIPYGVMDPSTKRITVEWGSHAKVMKEFSEKERPVYLWGFIEDKLKQLQPPINIHNIIGQYIIITDHGNHDKTNVFYVDGLTHYADKKELIQQALALQQRSVSAAPQYAVSAAAQYATAASSYNSGILNTQSISKDAFRAIIQKRFKDGLQSDSRGITDTDADYIISSIFTDGVPSTFERTDPRIIQCLDRARNKGGMCKGVLEWTWNYNEGYFIPGFMIKEAATDILQQTNESNEFYIYNVGDCIIRFSDSQNAFSIACVPSNRIITHFLIEKEGDKFKYLDDIYNSLFEAIHNCPLIGRILYVKQRRDGWVCVGISPIKDIKQGGSRKSRKTRRRKHRR